MITALFVASLIILLFSILIASRIVMLVAKVTQLADQVVKLLKLIQNANGIENESLNENIIPDDWLKRHGMKS